MHHSVSAFLEHSFSTKSYLDRKEVLEVGSRHYTGSPRVLVERYNPASYIGVDIARGPGVDVVCDATRLTNQFGLATFDVVIATEVLEHIEDWRGAISNIKHVLKPDGIIIATTRSKGFPLHGYPSDYWRYELSDIKSIFSDMRIQSIEPDPDLPGVFFVVSKPKTFRECSLDEIVLHSMVTGSRTVNITTSKKAFFLAKFKVRKAVGKLLPSSTKIYLGMKWDL